MKDDDRNTCADFIWIDDGDRWRPGSSVCYVSCRKSAGIVTGDHFDGRRAFTSYHYWNCSRSDQLYYTGKTKWENQKTEIAFGATGIVILLLFAAIFLLLWDARSGGLNEIQAIQEDVMYYYNTNLHINMLQITVCMVLLSTLGAVLDTALSITSSLYEVILHKPDMSRREIYHSGLQIGKDIIGTTVNTLFFAYLGDFLLLFFYLKNVKYTAEVILNSKMLFQGVSAMLFSAIACLLTVPVASAGCMLFLKKEEKKEEK